MSRLRSAVACAMLAGCAPPPMDSVAQGLAACARGAHHDEVRDSVRVVRVLGIRHGHEGFLIAAAGQTILVEDNVAITGTIPLHRGSAIEFQGQLECNDDVIHWTHRDPGGRHIDGYVVAGGTTYR